MTAIITTAEFTAFTNETLGDLPDAFVTNVLETVSQDVRDWTGDDIGQQTYTEERVQALADHYLGQASLFVRIDHPPIDTVSALSVYYVVDADPTSLSVTDVVLNSAKTGFWIPFGHFGTWRRFVSLGSRYIAEVTYVGGEDASYKEKMATALLAQEMFALASETSLTAMDTIESTSIGAYREQKGKRDLAASGGLGLGTALSTRARTLISKRKKSGVVFLG